MLDNPEPMIRIPRHLDPVPQPWQDRLQEKLWRARVALNEKNRATCHDMAETLRGIADECKSDDINAEIIRTGARLFAPIDWTLDGE